MFLVTSQYLLLSENAIILRYIYYLCIPGCTRIVSAQWRTKRSLAAKRS